MGICVLQLLDVWILKLDCISGVQNEYHHTAFLSKEKADHVAASMKGEWKNYKPETVVAEPISGERVIVNSKVYQLDRIPAKEFLKEQALAKLSKEEKQILELEE